ncbi:MAG TPA: heterodisulfide reductase-related iron-sulfur binding cluster [Pyrinomonadaceae bacterium]|jgi:glycolate oxidase iron-sulfur subunit|nr:heterodisulfide reductase-related iron-sulfur binding cluster [Pyrinomonadaceae bacterium]
MTTSHHRLAGALEGEERKLLACVHCGLCLEACPTYVHTGDENDSPRGRLYLMRAVEEGRLAPDSASFTRHIDRCLGCRACESVCPAGVEYGQLLEAARSDIVTGGSRRGWTSRLLHLLLRNVWPHPARLRLAFALARAMRGSRLPRLLLKSKLTRVIPARAELALALLDSSSPAPLGGNREGAAKAVETTHAPAGALLFKGCVTEGLFARVNRATARVLEANGCRADAPAGQVCCGALHAHAGDLEGARRLARRNVEAFEDDGSVPVVTNAGGCGAMLASYAHLLEDDPDFKERAARFAARVRDVSQQLEATGIREGAALDGEAATYDASCHLLHGQKAHTAPLRLLGAVPGLQLVPLEGSDVCCGGAGVYNLVETELSSRVLSEKLARVRDTGAAVLATGNPGCHMQIAAGASLGGMSLRVCHPVELLDESYRRAGFYEPS